MFAFSLAPLEVPLGFHRKQGSPTTPRKFMEIKVGKFIMRQIRQNEDFKNQVIHTNEMLRQLETKVRAMVTHNKMLETLIFQVPQQLASTSAFAGIFPG